MIMKNKKFTFDAEDMHINELNDEPEDKEKHIYEYEDTHKTAQLNKTEDSHIIPCTDTDTKLYKDEHTDTHKYTDEGKDESIMQDAYTDKDVHANTYTHTYKNTPEHHHVPAVGMEKMASLKTEIVVLRKEPRNRRLNFLASETAFENLRRFSEENHVSMNEVINQFLESLYK